MFTLTANVKSVQDYLDKLAQHIQTRLDEMFVATGVRHSFTLNGRTFVSNTEKT